MGSAEAATIVKAPIEVVWDVFNDIDHTHEWVVNLERAELQTTGEYGVGTVYHDYNRRGSKLEMMPWRITAFEPMKHQTHEGTSDALNLKMIVNFEPAPEGTQFQVIMEYELLPQMGLVGRLLEHLMLDRAFSQGLPQNLANMNAYVERVMSEVRQ
jgi:hypothetical protein